MASLAERLKIETRALHTVAERSRFMALLLRGRMERPAYCALLRNLHPVYAALEPALARHSRHPVIAPVYVPALARTEALGQDLRWLHGAGWAEAIDVLPAAARYVQRLRELDATKPALLLAHAYVRYLGDLSGGQMLRRIVAASLRLEHGAGTMFYDFGETGETLATAFRAGLGQVVVDAGGVDALVAEAVFAFEQHGRLFDELALAHGLAEDQQAAPAAP